MITGALFPKIRDTEKKFIILQGGGDAGKTSDTLKYIGLQAIYDPDVYTVTAQDTPNLKLGALRMFQRYVAPDPMVAPYIKAFNKTELTYTYHNGSIVEFKGFEDEQDARGSERGYLFLNEANSRNYEVFWQLQRKTRKKVIIDYNPSSPFWAHTKIMGLIAGELPEAQFAGRWVRFISNHWHNPFLTAEDHEAYENISDPDMYRVYSKGFTGMIKGLIYGHFKACSGPPEAYDRIIWGGDWGWTNDPTAIVKIWVQGRNIWCKQITYTPGMTADAIKVAMLENGYIPGDQPFYCDHDPGMINDLRILGVQAQPAIKGPGCEIARISKVREKNVWYFDSPEIEMEKGAYKFMTFQDITTGNEKLSNVPVKGNDHLMDAIGMAVYTDNFRHL